MTKTPGGKQKGTDDREARRAAALRENLLKRKQKQRDLRVGAKPDLDERTDDRAAIADRKDD